jgi:isopenicillin-N epimerase
MRNSWRPGHVPDEKYWEQVRTQFAVPPNLIMLNAANLCPPPAAVNVQVKKILDGLEKDVSFQYREQFSEKRKQALEVLAGFTGVSKEELALPGIPPKATTLSSMAWI